MARYSIKTSSHPEKEPQTFSPASAPFFRRRLLPIRRAELYHIPPSNSREWTFVLEAPTAEKEVHVVLPSAQTPGFIIPGFDPVTGELRVVAWEHLNDLLFWDPFKYFRTHPNVASVSVERVDSSLKPRYSKEPAEPETLLVLRRSECTYYTCNIIRAHQTLFFYRHDLELPLASEFVGTLHQH